MDLLGLKVKVIVGSKYASAVHLAAAIYVQVVQVKSWCRTVWEVSNCGNVSDMHRPCILSIIDFSLGLIVFDVFYIQKN